VSENKEKENIASEEVVEQEDTKVDVEVQADESTDEKVEEKAEEVEVEVVEELSEEEKQKNKIADLEDKLTRKIAEFENYRKRTAREYQDMIKSANERTLGDILDVADNFDLAMSHKDENITLETFAEGIEKIHNQVNSIIEKYDVKPIEAIGKQFDPNFHQALMQVESDEFEEGVIAFEMNKGYTMGDKVIRHSKVGVAKAKPKVEEVEEKTKEEDNKE